MHMLFTEQEKEWIDLRKWGWPLKKDCPENIRKSIERKKKIINAQKEVFDGKRHS